MASGMDGMKTQLLQLCEAGGLDQQGGKLCYRTVHTRSVHSTDDPGSQSFLPSQRSCCSCDVSRDSYLECVPCLHVMPDRHRMGFCSNPAHVHSMLRWRGFFQLIKKRSILHVKIRLLDDRRAHTWIVRRTGLHELSKG